MVTNARTDQVSTLSAVEAAFPNHRSSRRIAEKTQETAVANNGPLGHHIRMWGKRARKLL
jgi:hypothetical protein